MELRHTSGECRIERREDGGRVAVGCGSVFYRAGDAGTEYELWQGAVERIDPEAFAQALARPDDVRALFNHESDHLLGRSTSGTLRLSVDEIGLRYEIDLPDTQVGRDVATSIERGDLTGSSFAFVPTVVEWSDEGDREVRTIKDVTLYDVGPVTYPAYESASTGLRSIGTPGEAYQENLAWHAGREDEERTRRNREIQARIREIDLIV